VVEWLAKASLPLLSGNATNQDLSAWFDDEFRAADHPLTDLSGIADHLLKSAAKLPREAGLP
jgi:hypothetical protein